MLKVKYRNSLGKVRTEVWSYFIILNNFNPSEDIRKVFKIKSSFLAYMDTIWDSYNNSYDLGFPCYIPKTKPHVR